MLKEVNEYRINDEVTFDKLQEFGFVQGGFNCMIEEPKCFYKKTITDRLDLYIEISKDMKFTSENIMVFDTMTGDVCAPFYQNVDNEYTEAIAKHYNNTMDKLVEAGLLVNMTKENELNKRKNLK